MKVAAWFLITPYQTASARDHLSLGAKIEASFTQIIPSNIALSMM